MGIRETMERGLNRLIRDDPRSNMDKYFEEKGYKGVIGGLENCPEWLRNAVYEISERAPLHSMAGSNTYWTINGNHYSYIVYPYQFGQDYDFAVLRKPRRIK